MAMKIFKRDFYVSQLLVASQHHRILIVTGLRKVGKSTLIKELFLPKYKEINSIQDSHIIIENISSWKKSDRTIEHLEDLFESKIQDEKEYVVFLDEIQMVYGDYPAYLREVSANKPNVLICLSGSNSHGLSTDISKAFSDSAFSVPVFPLSYKEILSIFPDYPFSLYFNYGGLPDRINRLSVNANDIPRKNYLDDILEKTYIKDIYDHDKALAPLGLDKVRNILEHFSSHITTELSIRKAIQRVCEDYQKSRSRVLTHERRDSINSAFSNLISDYEKSYLAYIFEEEKLSLCSSEEPGYKEQRKLYISDQGLLNRLSAGSDKFSENLLENLVYLELKRAGYKPKGLDLSFEKDGKRKNGQIDFVFQNNLNRKVYIQVVYNFSDLNYDREISSLDALPSGIKIIVFFEENLLIKKVPDNIFAIKIETFCKQINSLLDAE